MEAAGGDAEVVRGFAGFAEEGSEGPFEDRAQRLFYEGVLDLGAVLPGALLQGFADDPQKDDEKDNDKQQQQDDDNDDINNNNNMNNINNNNSINNNHNVDETLSLMPRSLALASILNRIPLCVNTDTADKLSSDFCYHATKEARKRLVQSMMAAPKDQLVLLPYLARATANISTVFKDVAVNLAANLEKRFTAQLAKKEDPSLQGRYFYYIF